MQQITLNLPDSLVEQHAKYFGQVTNRDTEAVLADTLEMMWPAWKDLLSHKDYSPVRGYSEAGSKARLLTSDAATAIAVPRIFMAKGRRKSETGHEYLPESQITDLIIPVQTKHINHNHSVLSFQP
ncbi:MAG: hypothetical protein GY795_24350 [Desulfobacterales bacterium]|nr:hypothetical protein [Desulfobacterales bacterium]